MLTDKRTGVTAHNAFSIRIYAKKGKKLKFHFGSNTETSRIRQTRIQPIELVKATFSK